MALVKKYASVVTQFVNKGENLYFAELKTSSGHYKYSPGQFLHLALDEYDPSSGWPESRCFSMQSAPSEEFIRITFAAKGAFTNRMKNELHPGKNVTLKLPYGNLFDQPHHKDKTVFIAGGTGVTPFLSLFDDKSFATYTNPLLYLGFRSRIMNIYDHELEAAKKINPSFTANLFYEDETGILNIDNILKENSAGQSFFISGPPLMIKFFKKFLMEHGVDESNVLNDEWE
jgi:ferredoxin-NADP reductase